MDLIFNNHIVKVINRDFEPFFYGSKLAKMLNYVRPGNALENHVSEENKIKVQSLNPGLRFLINEIGVYELIFSSNLPQAKAFRNFVFKVVFYLILENNLYLM
jgi:anti-repressor protein